MAKHWHHQNGDMKVNDAFDDDTDVAPTADAATTAADASTDTAIVVVGWLNLTPQCTSPFAY